MGVGITGVGFGVGFGVGDGVEEVVGIGVGDGTEINAVVLHSETRNAQLSVFVN